MLRVTPPQPPDKRRAGMNKQQQLEARLTQIEARLAKIEAMLDTPDTIPAPPVTTTRHRVAGAFARRYEAARAMPWNYGAHTQHLEEIAQWIDRQAQLSGQAHAEIGKRLLDNWFATDWAKRVDYKPRFLNENIGTVYNPPAVKREDEPDPEAINARRIRQRQMQEQAELERKLRNNEEKAYVPPKDELDGLVSRLMDKWG